MIKIGLYIQKFQQDNKHAYVSHLLHWHSKMEKSSVDAKQDGVMISKLKSVELVHRRIKHFTMI